MKKSTRAKKTEYTILYKNVNKFPGKIVGRDQDFAVHEFKVMASSPEDAEKKFFLSRVYFYRNERNRNVRGVNRYAIVRTFTDKPIPHSKFKNYRGKVESKFVTVLPTKVSPKMFHNWGHK